MAADSHMERGLLRHAVATLAYRAGKTVRGAPIRPENYFRADIVAGRAGKEQAAPVQEFD